MNFSRTDTVNSTYLYISIALSLIILLYPFYVYWVVYFLNEVVFLRRKIRGLLHRTPTLETNNELFNYTGNYYTYILIIVIALLEPNNLVPAILSLLPYLFEDGKPASVHSCDIRALSYIMCMVTARGVGTGGAGGALAPPLFLGLYLALFLKLFLSLKSYRYAEIYSN